MDTCAKAVLWYLKGDNEVFARRVIRHIEADIDTYTEHMCVISRYSTQSAEVSA